MCSRNRWSLFPNLPLCDTAPQRPCTPPNAPRPLPPWVTDKKRAHMYATPRPMPPTEIETYDFGDDCGATPLSPWSTPERSWSGSNMTDFMDEDEGRGAACGTPSSYNSDNSGVRFFGNVTPPYRPQMGRSYYTSCHKQNATRGVPFHTPARRVAPGCPFRFGPVHDEVRERIMLNEKFGRRQPRNPGRYLQKRFGEGMSRVQQAFGMQSGPVCDMDLDPNTRNLAMNMDLIRTFNPTPPPKPRNPRRYISKRCGEARRALINRPEVQYVRDKYDHGMGMAERAAFALLRSRNPPAPDETEC